MPLSCPPEHVLDSVWFAVVSKAELPRKDASFPRTFDTRCFCSKMLNNRLGV